MTTQDINEATRKLVDRLLDGSVDWKPIDDAKNGIEALLPSGTLVLVHAYRTDFLGVCHDAYVSLIDTAMGKSIRSADADIKLTLRERKAFYRLVRKVHADHADAIRGRHVDAIERALRDA